MSEKLSDAIFALVDPHDHEGPNTQKEVYLVNLGMAARALESFLAQAHINIETLERMNQAVRRALGEAIPGWEGSGAGIVESIGWLAQAQADVEALRNKYSELLYGVATKHPGESRHETALRYILERENRSSGPTSAALPEYLRGASR